MPRAPRTCVDCKGTAHNGNRCEDCRLKRARTTDRRRPTANQRGYDKRWQQTRAEHLRREPNCRSCGKPGRHVDHIDGAGPLAPNGHDHANLQTLCHSCHSTKTATVDGGGWGGTAAPT